MGAREPEPNAGERQRLVYERDAARYDELVSAEDADGDLRAALSPFVRAAPLVLDLGTGTGRVARLLGEYPRGIVALDASVHMLRGFRSTFGGPLVRGVADAGALPLATDSVDLTLAGWVFGHAVVWCTDDWHALVDRYIAELERVTGGGGTIVVIESLGTGVEAPRAPTLALADYHVWLDAAGFAREVVRTDYVFASLERAVELVEAFFGPELARDVAARGAARVPEYSGLWTREVTT